MRSNQTQDELEGFGVPTTKSIYANRNPVSLTFIFLPVLIPAFFSSSFKFPIFFSTSCNPHYFYYQF